ncbi:MAG: DUF3606 domain-containing protein [Hydrogenophaga sp.]|uniref:DUF3606 domain-containing protein n=1 Tax=Hydrogenophaga sp. TaxID=1904254 RepID=UPI004034F968
MATSGDDPKKKKQDGKLVSRQDHERDYLAKTTGKSLAEIEKAIKAVGPSREKVLQYLKGK